MRPSNFDSSTYHVRHQVRGIAADIEELESEVFHEALEHPMCADTDAMSLLFELEGERDERLDVTCSAGCR